MGFLRVGGLILARLVETLETFDVREAGVEKAVVALDVLHLNPLQPLQLPPALQWSKETVFVVVVVVAVLVLIFFIIFMF